MRLSEVLTKDHKGFKSKVKGCLILINSDGVYYRFYCMMRESKSVIYGTYEDNYGRSWARAIINNDNLEIIKVRGL